MQHCKLYQGTKDGFYEKYDYFWDLENSISLDTGPDPPCSEKYCQLIPGTDDGFPSDIEPLPSHWND